MSLNVYGCTKCWKLQNLQENQFNTNDHKKNLMWKDCDGIKQIRKYNVKQSKKNLIN